MNEAATQALMRELAAAVGPGHLKSGPGLEAHEIDWRRRWHGRALAVVSPATTDEVAAVVRACAGAGVAIVPQGGHTGLVGGGTPDESGQQLVLSTRRLNRIRALDPDNLTITVEAGCILQSVQEAAADQGLLFPLSLAAEGSCTIGGNLATNAGGTQVLRFGNARELCLGLEVVTPEGEILQALGGLRKDNTGYSLRDLYVGSEGTLGIITAATLKLFPQPSASLTALAACPSADMAVALLGLARQRLGSTLTGYEVMNAFSRELVARHCPQIGQPLRSSRGDFPVWSVLMEQADEQGAEQAQQRLEALLSEALENGLIEDAVVAKSIAESRAFWHLRESIPLAQSQEGLNIKHDISLPVSRIGAYIESTDAELLQAYPGCRIVNFGHLGDGNLHYNIQAPAGTDAKTFLEQHEAAINTRVFDAVGRLGGSISAEHGIGRLKRDELTRRKDATALALMQRIKRALDPMGILNPGRLLVDEKADAKQGQDTPVV